MRTASKYPRHRLSETTDWNSPRYQFARSTPIACFNPTANPTASDGILVQIAEPPDFISHGEKFLYIPHIYMTIIGQIIRNIISSVTGQNDQIRRGRVC